MYAFEMPGVALPFAVGALAAGACGAGERDRVAAIFEQMMDGVDVEIVKETFPAAVALKMDKAAVPYHGYDLGINGDEGRWGRLETQYAKVFICGNAKVFIIRKRLVGIPVPVFLEPGLVGRDGVVELDEDGLHGGGDVGTQGYVEELGAVKEGVQ